MMGLFCNKDNGDDLNNVGSNEGNEWQRVVKRTGMGMDDGGLQELVSPLLSHHNLSFSLTGTGSKKEADEISHFLSSGQAGVQHVSPSSIPQTQPGNQGCDGYPKKPHVLTTLPTGHAPSRIEDFGAGSDSCSLKLCHPPQSHLQPGQLIHPPGCQVS
ncbi:hypothetical protein E5288_WYG012933 [Bos mutus]|uniref:Uncharacterized protein n=1 Tax=Bos mutus TaxID=72004 RepID=A0A6B0RA47_9CETA|nr:hypothetical protein [Bos mutus]